MKTKNKLKDLRRATGLTMREASEIIGVGINTLNNWESGTTEPTPRHIVRLSDAYKTKPAKILAALKEYGN